MDELESLRLARAIRRYAKKEDLDVEDTTIEELLDSLEGGETE